jgi:CRP-like cAMP-binding protein
MYDVPRTATVTARTDLQLFALDRETFLITLLGNANVHDSAHELAQIRLEESQTLSVVAEDGRA